MAGTTESATPTASTTGASATGAGRDEPGAPPAADPAAPVAVPPAVSPAALPARYRAPGWFTRNVVNRPVAWLTRHGLSVWGSRVLAVRGRASGEWRETPVNLLAFDGREYLVSPRGTTQWVRNLRVAGSGRLSVGRQHVEFTAVELPDAEKVPLLRAYLRRWRFEVGVFFEGVGPGASDAELLAIGPKHPVFEVRQPAPTGD